MSSPIALITSGRSSTPCDLRRGAAVADVRVVEDVVQRPAAVVLADQVRGDALLLARASCRGTRTRCGRTCRSPPPGRLYPCPVAPGRSRQDGSPSASIEGVDDGGSAERIVIWIERKEGGVWAVGRAVNPQHRPSDEPRRTTTCSRATSCRTRSTRRTRRSRTTSASPRATARRPAAAVQAERDPRAARALVLRQQVILVVAATERELAATGRRDTLCCGIGPAEAGIRTAMGARRAAARRRAPRRHRRRARARARLSVVIGSEARLRRHRRPGLAMPRVERAYPAPELVEAARRALPDAHVLPITSCARVGGGGECDVEAMEGFSVLRAAELAGVPAVEVRTISNRPASPTAAVAVRGRARRGSARSSRRLRRGAGALRDADLRLLALPERHVRVPRARARARRRAVSGRAGAARHRGAEPPRARRASST